MAWGLDKAVLKRIWDLVAGTAAQLSQVQFSQAVYLMDAAKRGLPLPPALPPGQFPPLAGAPGGPGSSGGAAPVPPVSLASLDRLGACSVWLQWSPVDTVLQQRPDQPAQFHTSNMLSLLVMQLDPGGPIPTATTMNRSGSSTWFHLQCFLSFQ